METQPTLRISIPKPCDEDWNKFTPDEKGAFCKVCSKSVHDFTKKSAGEIAAIMTEEISAGNKVCGRFNEDQLEVSTPIQKGEMPALVSFLSPRDSFGTGGGKTDRWALNFTRIKKFAVPLFLVFGGYLFNSVKSSAQKMGKVEITYNCRIPREVACTPPPPVEKSNTTVIIHKICSKGSERDAIAVKTAVTEIPKSAVDPISIKDHMVFEPFCEQAVGQVAVTEVVPSDIDIKGEEIIEDPMIIGLIVMPVYSHCGLVNPKLIAAEEVKKDSTEITIVKPTVPESTYVETEEPILKRQEETPEFPVESPALLLKCFPNPSADGFITLRYDLKKDGLASISIFDLNGSLVKSLVLDRLIYASIYETRFDVSDLPDGVYFCELISGGNKTTERIVISK